MKPIYKPTQKNSLAKVITTSGAAALGLNDSLDKKFTLDYGTRVLIEDYKYDTSLQKMLAACTIQTGIHASAALVWVLNSDLALDDGGNPFLAEGKLPPTSY